MFVSKSMTRKLITIEKETGILEIRKLMDDNKVRHLPVVDDDGLLLGMVTDRDVRSALPYAMYWDTGDAEERERIRGWEFEGDTPDLIETIKNAEASVRQIIRELEASLTPLRSPMVLNGGGYGLTANHSLVMANYLARANAAVINLRELLDQG
mgnify:CR=1 FL=1